MTSYLGISFALLALVSWGLGDFLIHRTTRSVGVSKALFFIGAAGFIVLLPFVRDEIFTLGHREWLSLLLLGLIAAIASLFDLTALKHGKIAVIEPVSGLELPLTVGLSVGLGGELLTSGQLILIADIFIGIVLTITVYHALPGHRHRHRKIFEKGVIMAVIGAFGMALTNFLVGVASQKISPLMTIWFVHSLVAAISAVYLIHNGEIKNILSDIRNNPKPIIIQSVFDNVAWVAFAFATTLIPIAVATAISESYIALAASLGIFINREKLQYYQIVGVILTISGVIALAAFTTH